MITHPRAFPPMPKLGQPESYYAQLAHQAEEAGDIHAHEAAKVGQYVTLALDTRLSWDEKLKYLRHALKRHCQPPPFADEEVWNYYRALADLVKQYAGQEALRIASTEDDMYAARLSMGQDRSAIEDEAEVFFAKIMGRGDECPDFFLDEDWQQIKLIRDQWI